MESPGKSRGKTTSLPPILQRLRSENEQLRQQLRDYSSQLDSLITHMPRKSLNFHEIRQKELSNARKQLESYEKQLKDVQRAQSRISPTKFIDLESVLTVLTTEIKSKEATIRSLRRVEQDRSTALRSLSADSDSSLTLKAASSALRGARQSVLDVEREIQRGEETFKVMRGKIVDLEGKYKKIVETERENSDEPKQIPVETTDIRRKKETVETLDRKKCSEQVSYRREVMKAEETLVALNRELQESAGRLKEKEREGRVLALAVKEGSKSLQQLLKKVESLGSEVEVQSKSQAFLTEAQPQP